jgi:hypothetical protein
MSLTTFRQVKCPCGEIINAELWSSINVEQNPELKEILLAGELNVIKCPKCGIIFYAEQFVLYFDPPNELLVFVYPADFVNKKDYWYNKMMDDFNKIKEDILNSDKKLTYLPLIFFGLDELVNLLKYEDQLLDEISVLENVSSNLNLKLLKISLYTARSKHIPYILPYIEVEDVTLRDKIILGIRKLVEVMPDMITYKDMLNRIDEITFDKDEIILL